MLSYQEFHCTGRRGRQKWAGRVFFLNEFIILTMTCQLLQQMCGKIKEGRLKSEKALTSSRNFISCTMGARRKRRERGERTKERREKSAAGKNMAWGRSVMGLSAELTLTIYLACTSHIWKWQDKHNKTQLNTTLGLTSSFSLQLFFFFLNKQRSSPGAVTLNGERKRIAPLALTAGAIKEVESPMLMRREKSQKGGE